MNQYNRNDWGFYAKNHDSSDITIPYVMKNNFFLGVYDKTPNKYQSVDEKKKDDLGGGAFMESLKKNLAAIPQRIAQASEAYSGPIGTTLRNMIPPSDENARASFQGEKHAILQLPNGKNGIANYMGPGTEVIKRLQRNDPGRTESDKVAKRHDIDYVLAQGEPTKAAQLVKVREADNRMIKSLQKIRENKTDANRNIQMGLRLIQAKVAGENLGVLDKSKFAGDIKNINPEDRILLEAERNKSEQSGYGINGKLLPGQKLKMALLNNKVKGPKKPRLAGQGLAPNSLRMDSYPSKSKDIVSQKGYTLKGNGRNAPNIAELKIKGKKGKGLKLAGQGLNIPGMGIALAGGSINIIDEIKNKALPALMKQIKLNIPSSEITKIVDKHITDTSNISNLSNGLMSMADELLPMAIAYMLKQVNINPLELQKKGIFTDAINKMTGQGMKGMKGKKGKKGKGMKGYGMLDNIKEILGPIKDNAVNALYNGLLEFVKNLVKGKSGGSMIMTGAGFWSDFAKGFKIGWNKTLDIISAPIKIFMPELAPAIEVGKAIGSILPG